MDEYDPVRMEMLTAPAIPGQWKSGEAERSWAGELLRLNG